MSYVVLAALSSLTISTILLVTQSRRSFRRVREAFVSRATARNTATADDHRGDEGTFVIGFFHPRCGAGGGGERVLWKAIQALAELKEDAIQCRGDFDEGLRHDSLVTRHCRNLAVAVYTIDEPKEGYARGEIP
jgi:hypothetical protein